MLDFLSYPTFEVKSDRREGGSAREQIVRQNINEEVCQPLKTHTHPTPNWSKNCDFQDDSLAGKLVFRKKREKKRRKGSSGEQKERKKEMASICKWQFGIKLDPSYSGRRLQRRRRRQQCQKRRQQQQQQQYGGGRVERTEGEETENLASCNESFKNIEKQWFLSKKLAIHWKDLSQSISLRGETEWCDIIGHTRNEEVQLFWVATIAFINCLGGKTSDFPWGRCGFGSQVRWTRRLKKMSGTNKKPTRRPICLRSRGKVNRLGED